MNNKRPFESKKFIALVVGVSFTSIFTIISLCMISIVPAAASSIVNLVTVSLASLNGIVGLYSVGQSAVDWKINSQHATLQENKIIDETQRLIIDAKNHEMKYNDGVDISWDNYMLDKTKRD